MPVNVCLTNVFWEFKGFNRKVISYPKNPYNNVKALAKQIIQKFKKYFAWKSKAYRFGMHAFEMRRDHL